MGCNTVLVLSIYMQLLNLLTHTDLRRSVAFKPFINIIDLTISDTSFYVILVLKILLV